MHAWGCLHGTCAACLLYMLLCVWAVRLPPASVLEERKESLLRPVRCYRGDLDVGRCVRWRRRAHARMHAWPAGCSERQAAAAARNGAVCCSQLRALAGHDALALCPAPSRATVPTAASACGRACVPWRAAYLRRRPPRASCWSWRAVTRTARSTTPCCKRCASRSTRCSCRRCARPCMAPRAAHRATRTRTTEREREPF